MKLERSRELIGGQASSAFNSTSRRLPVGAELTPEGVGFRVWAPGHSTVEVVFERRTEPRNVALRAEGNGYFSERVASAGSGTLYRFRLDGHRELWPDPASRFQPDGPLGPSQVVDPGRYTWGDAEWPGITIEDQVLYEMHVGTFTAEGTWVAAAERLRDLANLGVTTIELMPIAEFPGRFGWSYDGVSLFAPNRQYGWPDDFRRFVDRAHRVGIGVILDVVYNHWSRLGEQVVTAFTDSYVSRRHENEWGAPVNFDGPDSAGVREFFLANVKHWIVEYHLDGMRIDATQAIHDDSTPHVVLEMVQAARQAAGPRRVIMVGENEPQQTQWMTPAERGGYELDALWNDDFHHTARVCLTGSREAYYTDYRGSPAELVASAKWGYLYQGQRYSWQHNPRGSPALEIPAMRFVNYLQNHDQIANSRDGDRIGGLTTARRLRAMTALFLLMPQTPMLFQGQEVGASGPFLYFNDCPPEEAPSVRAGRTKFLEQFRSLATLDPQSRQIDPCDEHTFARCKLDWSRPCEQSPIWRMHRDLLSLRRSDSVLSRRSETVVDGAVLANEAFALRFFGLDGNDRLLVVNFGIDVTLGSIAEPLIAPPAQQRWKSLWCSEWACYGGSGAPPSVTDEGWILTAGCAVLLQGISRGDPDD